MHEYELRILNANRTTDLVIEVAHINDNAAIRQGRKIAEGRPFEVWRGLDCVYGTHKEAPPERHFILAP